jgi:hypothetical protein
MDQIQNQPIRSLARDLVRCIALVAILTDGLLLMLLSQVSSTDYKALARFELLNFIGFAAAVAIYLAATRTQNWKFLIPFSLLVSGVVLELLNRVY